MSDRAKLRIKDMPPEVQHVHRLLLKAERHAIHALLISRGIRPSSTAGRIWYRWIKNGVRKAHKAFGNPTGAEVGLFVAAEIRRDLKAKSSSPASSPVPAETERDPTADEFPVEVDAALPHRGLCVWTDFDFHGRSTKPKILLRDEAERETDVLLHETLHALIGTAPGDPCPPGSDEHERLVRHVSGGLWRMGWRLFPAPAETGKNG